MEKLQAALEKARNKRVTAGQTTDAAAPAPTPKPARTLTGHKAELWDQLTEIRPASDVLQSHNVVSQQASDQATPFDILRTKVLLQMQQNGWKSLAITSPMPKSGKTTMACNLALGLGRQSGLHTILFDFDLKDPSVGDFLGHRPESSISDMLAGQVSFAEQAVRIGQNVAVSMANHRESDPTRILLAERTRECIEDVQKTYAPDITIFDMPSILVGDNTRAFLKNVDCALIVARADNTKYGHFDACEREIAEYTNVLGVVLNASRAKNLEHAVE